MSLCLNYILFCYFKLYYNEIFISNREHTKNRKKILTVSHHHQGTSTFSGKIICSVSILPVIYGKRRGHLLTNQSFHFHHSRTNSLFCDNDFAKFTFRVSLDPKFSLLPTTIVSYFLLHSGIYLRPCRTGKKVISNCLYLILLFTWFDFNYSCWHWRNFKMWKVYKTGEK